MFIKINANDNHLSPKSLHTVPKQKQAFDVVFLQHIRLIHTRVVVNKAKPRPTINTKGGSNCLFYGAEP